MRQFQSLHTLSSFAPLKFKLYVHDNSKTEVQSIPIAELELAWEEDYIGISKKNAYFGIDMKSPETDIGTYPSQTV